MNRRIITTLIVNDYKNLIRDKFVSIMSILGLALFILFYFLMPNNIDETIEIGVYAPHASNMYKNIPEKALIIREAKTENELKQSIIDKKFFIGISIPDDLLKAAMSGNRPKIFVYHSSGITDEIQEMITVLIGEIVNEMSGYKISIENIEMVLGPDMGGKQIPYRDRLLPCLVFMLLISEIIGLTNLITSELRMGTIQALMTTPMKVVDFFIGKGISGIFLGLSQIALLMILTKSLNQNMSIIVTALLLGSMMVTGLAFIIASISKDMMSVIGWSTLLMIVLVIPPFIVIFPGPVSGWIKTIPSFFLVDVLHRAVNFDIGWRGNVKNILLLSGFNIVFVFTGIVTLKRKVK